MDSIARVPSGMNKSARSCARAAVQARTRGALDHARDEKAQTNALDSLAEQWPSCEVRDLDDGGLAVRCYAASPPDNVIGLHPVARFYIDPEGRRYRVG